MIENYYNADTPLNVLSTAMMITSLLLHKEGYKMEDIKKLVETMGTLTAQVLKGNAKITETGIEFITKDNVVDLSKG